ncbi:NAD(P)/FAD-dependent oxidoreductase [Mycobacterium senriense]|uniref:Amine oxidase domain-containing protein n=1 Tax=Mycobacterium senriense TaxID=2775496 RepID=A0ABM7SYP9_9MYCO|nr:NAD(P)/FAD-dependent oxidoreductase [Mycobacterium senriense]BCZ23363.1 hypothetical protein MTY59_32180 [Mycobacterium senriense]
MSTSNHKEPERVNSDGSRPVAIVGGGITGLFCAYVLASNKYHVDLFESSEQFGGRIRSFLLNRELMDECVQNEREDKPNAVEDKAVIDKLTVKEGEYENLEFCAEFGPMRIELDVQVLLKYLLTHLGIDEDPKRNVKTPRGANQKQKAETALEAAHRESFSSFSSPTSEADPLYKLRPDEEGKNPLELMSLALCRAVVHTIIDRDEVDSAVAKGAIKEEEKRQGYQAKLNKLIVGLRNAAAVQEPIGPVFDKWAKTLREDDYWVIARYGCIDIGSGDSPVYIPLYTMGFWNLMSIYLSHNALTKVRDLGTFYHLLPENPNAAHWFTWQLRQLSISNQLEGINGGMQAITNNLLFRKMGYVPDSEPSKGGTCTVDETKIKLFLKAQVSSIKKSGAGLQLTLERGGPHADPDERYSRVILALPKAPAHQLVVASPDLKDVSNKRDNGKTRLPDMLDSSFGFPMVKAFFVVRDRWWEEAKRANWFATRFPTREVHYWKSCDPRSRRGMVMLYTDRPASSFWANYVPAGRQNDVEELCPDGVNDDARKKIRTRLKQRLVQYINENNVPDITADDIIWCGIMDWGRLPYGAANHAWRPERKFWEAMADLAEIELGTNGGQPPLHVHVCGEAFADYTGFIEGSLRSATYTLTKILRKDEKDSTTEVLKRIFKVLDVDSKHLDEAKKKLESQTSPGEPGPQSCSCQPEQETPSEETESKLKRERDYLEDLMSWIDTLDKC